MANNIPVIVQGNSFTLSIPLQIYVIDDDEMVLEDYTPEPTDKISVQLKGSRRNYTYTPTSVEDNVVFIPLSGNELADNYAVVVSIVKADGQRLRSFRSDQFFIVESSDDLTEADIVEGLEENVIYLNSSIFVAGADGRGIASITKTGTSGLVDTYTITYTDNTTSTFTVTNGAQGEQGATIASVEKTATVGKVDTYTITMTNGNTFDFEVTNGMNGVDLGLANVVNDLTTGGATNVLSAEQGKVLRNTTPEIGDGASDTDLEVWDGDGNVLAIFKDGGLLTNEFDSTKTPSIGGTNVDFAVTDESGENIVEFADGHIKTKNFDSRNVSAKKDYQRENRFTIEVECSQTNDTDFDAVNINTHDTKKVYSDNAVLYLPTTYSIDSTPTQVIIFCKQGGSQVTNSSDPVFNLNIFNYLMSLGYAVLAVDGMPDGLTQELHLDDTRVVGNYVAVQSVRRAWDYVTKNYNVKSDGCHIFGYSQGGMYALNVADLSDIPILSSSLLSPTCSMLYHQWDLEKNVTIDNVTWTKPARRNIALLFGMATLQSLTTNAQLLALNYDAEKVIGYDPWIRNVENPYTGFAQNGFLWQLPSGTSLDSITMKKQFSCPTKIWCATNDASLGVDVMKVFIKAGKNAGQECDMRVYSSGGHSIYNSQTAIGTFTENGTTYNLYPLAYDIGLWMERWGGYNVTDLQ